MKPLQEILKTITAGRIQHLMRNRVELEVVGGTDAGKKQTFEESLTLGARSPADFLVKDGKVSGLHCAISVKNEIRIRDLDSKNGTFVRGVRVYEAALPPGEVAQIGDTTFRLRTVGQVEVPLSDQVEFHGLVGSSTAIRALTAKISAAAASSATVLIQGETGSGKEVIAEALHLASARAQKPLVVVDCGALPPNLIESELFGHERGAFTGANTTTDGAFLRANGGTLFLDEIGELPLDMQPKLLRAIESRTVKRVGGAKPQSIDVRLVAATNRDLALEASRGRFREDLYFRLAVVQLKSPPLRERRDDIPQLAAHLLEGMNIDPASCLTAESIAALQDHDWPGNVRELKNTLERAVAQMRPVSHEDLDRRELPQDPMHIDLALSFKDAKRRVVDQFEGAYVAKLLEACNGNASLAARRAGIDRMSIYRIIERLQLKR